MFHGQGALMGSMYHGHARMPTPTGHLRLAFGPLRSDGGARLVAHAQE
jgi:hypothetical protein